MQILISGKPGSGKSMISHLLATELNLIHICSGDIARELVKDNIEGSVRLEDGQLCDMEEALRSRVVSMMGESIGGFVLEGYPRHVGQLDVVQGRIDFHVMLAAPDVVCGWRMCNRGGPRYTERGIFNKMSIYDEMTHAVALRVDAPTVRIDAMQEPVLMLSQILEALQKAGLVEDLA